MSKLSNEDSLIRALYGASLADDGWAPPLQQVAHRLEAGNFHLMVWQAHRSHPAYSLTRGMEASVEARYRAHYGAVDPRRLLVAGQSEGDWLLCHRHFDARSVARDEFWQDYLIPAGWRWLMGTRLVRDGDNDVFFGLHRSPEQPAFDEAGLAFVRRITGHFQIAARLWLQTVALRERALLGWRALDALEYAVLALDAQTRPLFVNRLGEALLREGHSLTVRSGRVTAASGDDERVLVDTLRRCRQTGQSASLRLRAGPVVTVMTSPSDDSAVGRVLSAELLLLVTHGRRHRVLGARQLMQLYSLTPAEARLARALAGGATLDSYATEAQVRRPTVRAQLQAVFEKVGCSRQSDLVRRLVVVPVQRDPLV